MKVLVVAGWMYPDFEGGSFRVAYDIARSLAARGHKVFAITQKPERAAALVEEVDGVLFFRYPASSGGGIGFYWRTLAGIDRVLRRYRVLGRVDVVHLHHLVSSFAASIHPLLRRVPAVMTYHAPYFLERMDAMGLYDERREGGGERREAREDGSDERVRRIAAGFEARTSSREGLRLDIPARLLRRMDAVVLRRARRVSTLSQYVASQVAIHFPGVARKTAVVPGGVDTEFFKPVGARGAVRARLGFDEGNRVILTVRRLEPRMGLENLLEAFGTVRREIESCRLVVAGRGSLEASLRERAEALGLGKWVTFLGFVEHQDLPELYSAAECFVLPTRALEGFGISTLEALSCGTPVLGTDVGGTPEILRSLSHELVIESESPEAIAGALVRFLRGKGSFPDRRACRDYVEKSFSVDRMADAYEKLLQGVCAPPGL